MQSERSQMEEADAVIAAPAATITDEAPAEIPPEPYQRTASVTTNDAPVDEEDEVEDDEEEYEYEDDDDAAFSGFLVQQPTVITNPPGLATTNSTSVGHSEPATIEDDPVPEKSPSKEQKKWRQPSQQAVSMSIRAEQETSGGKRRLAQDLYRIMNQDTHEAGFSLAPTSEDSMDKWTIKLFQFDEDSKLAKDMLVLSVDAIELEMSFPDQYPFEPPFVRVVRPRFKRQTGFVMNGALCMELLTKDGWNPINDIESVIVSIRSLLVVGDGRLEAACNLSESRYNALLTAAETSKSSSLSSPQNSNTDPAVKRQRKNSDGEAVPVRESGGSYSVSEAEAAYSHLSDYHKKKGWDASGWWARKG